MAARKKTAEPPAPHIGLGVHFVADSIPGEAAEPSCCAAIVTALRADGPSLAVLMPAGYEFREQPHTLDTGIAGDEPTSLCDTLVHEAGTWHPAVTA